MSAGEMESSPSLLYEEIDTVLLTSSLVPFSSDGPTLPCLSGDSDNKNPYAYDPTPTPPFADENQPKKRKSTWERREGESATKKARKSADYNALCTPWKLLPLEVRKRVEEERWSGDGGAEEGGWERCCIPIVYTRNQNITSAVNRLKAYLGYSDPRSLSRGDVDVPAVSKDGDESERNGEAAVIAVSAQADATVKLVSIVEMVKRIVAGDDTEDDMEDNMEDVREGRKEAWYSYTSLSSRVQSTSSSPSTGTNAADTPLSSGRCPNPVSILSLDLGSDYGEDVEPNTFENRATTHEVDEDEDEEEKETKPRRVPVLTVWMSRRRIDALARAFGEERFKVHKNAREDGVHGRT